MLSIHCYIGINDHKVTNLPFYCVVYGCMYVCMYVCTYGCMYVIFGGDGSVNEP